jgi:putative membrane protein
MEPNLRLAKKLNTAAWIMSGLVLALVAAMRKIHLPLPEGVSLDFLPPFHATVNALTAVAILTAYYFIRKKQVERHRKTIYVAIALSVVFLLSYVTYHITSAPVLFGDANHDGMVGPEEVAAVGSLRTVYLLLLLSHIVLAAVIFPFILFTFVRGYTDQVARHRRMARWVIWVWLYVAVSGPVCYLMLKPYF